MQGREVGTYSYVNIPSRDKLVDVDNVVEYSEPRWLLTVRAYWGGLSPNVLGMVKRDLPRGQADCDGRQDDRHLRWFGSHVRQRARWYQRCC